MIEFKTGDIALVQFPFTDLTSAKRRPALILNDPGYSALYGDLVLLALTSQPQTDSRLALTYWRGAGLPKPTWAKPLVGTISGELVSRILGTLDVRDVLAIQYTLSLAIATEWLHKSAG